jgi:uncharacterized membrane protein YphA (DoxX/SURF4 family)
MTTTNRTATVARILLGLGFFVFGLNGFLHFLPAPSFPEDAGVFLGALAATGYFFPLLKATETISGILLLSGRFVPLALTLLAPILVNILAFHAFLAPAGILPGLVLAVLEIIVAYQYRDSFRGVLIARATPAGRVEPRRAHRDVHAPA